MPLEIEADLKGEIPLADFEIGCDQSEERQKEIYKKMGGVFNSWLRMTVDGGYLWTDSADYEQHQHDLASYFNEQVKGPYFIFPEFANTRATLSFIFFDRAEADAFLEKFGQSHHYKLREDAFEKNLNSLADRRQNVEWVPLDERLKPYVEQALSLRK